jgi:hypothetical protein
MEARYTATSVGGKRSVQELALAVAEQADKDSSKIVAVVTLGRDSYSHKSYGRIFTPVFSVQSWVGMDGPVEESTEAPAAEPATQGRRRRVA